MGWLPTCRMKNNGIIVVLMIALLLSFMPCHGDTLTWQGQFSAMTQYGHQAEYPFRLGGNLIPQVNAGIELSNETLLDFEGSVHITGSGSFTGAAPNDYYGKVKPYRLWARYSGRQFEVRGGLQKINFGPAMMLRPLMWFDQIDPRDPLQLTEGVWGVLGRYYLLNNANLWAWVLYGNEGQRAWDTGKPASGSPEWGGRVQWPIPCGEAALTSHFRKVDGASLYYPLDPEAVSGKVSEQRWALDGRWDVLVGLWFEAVWIHKADGPDLMRNHQMLTVGADYTFGVGNGLHVVGEHFVTGFGSESFVLGKDPLSFSALSLSYPVSLVHNVSAIVYYDWKNNDRYQFVNWRMDLKHFDLYLMGYVNPEGTILPQQRSANTMGGKGALAMIVINF